MYFNLHGLSLKQWCVLVTICVTCCLGKPSNGTSLLGLYSEIKTGSTGLDDGTISNTYIYRTMQSVRHKRGATPGLSDVARFSSSSAPGKTFMVYVDDTMKRLIFQVSVERSNPVIIATTPAGIPCSVHPVLTGNPTTGGTVTAVMDIPLTGAADYGFWKFQKLDANTWDVTIQCESPLSVTHQLYDLNTANPHDDYPVLGKSYKLQVTVAGYSTIKSVDLGFLYSRSKVSPIGMVVLLPKGGGVYEAASVNTPKEVFMVGIQGSDNSGHMFKRLDPTEITPVTVKLDVSPFNGATVDEYSTYNITFTVTNLLSTDQEVDVRIEDDRGFATAPKFLSDTIKSGGTFKGIFVLQSSFAGLTTLVTIKARQYLGSGQFSPGPVEIGNVTVIKNFTSTTSTSTTTTTPTTTTSTTTTPTTTSTTTSTTPSTSTSTTTPSTTSTTSTTKPTTTSTTPKLTTKSTTTKPTNTASTSIPISKTMANTARNTQSLLPSSTKSSVTSSQSAIAQSSSLATAGTSKVSVVSSAITSVTSSVKQTQPGSNTAAQSTGIPGVTSAVLSNTSQSVKTSTSGPKSSGASSNIQNNNAQSSTSSPTNTNAPGGSGSSTVTITATSTNAASSNSGSGSNSDSSDSTTLEISAGVVVASMVTGTIVGIAAIATMAVVFNKALNKKDKRVAPDNRKQSTSSERTLTPVWT